MKTFLASLRLIIVLTLLTGTIYPLAVWLVGHTFFRVAAEGSLVERGGHVVGSALIAQQTADPRYFFPRPSAGNYATVASGASNLAWTSAKFRESADAAARQFREQNGLPADAPLPSDLVTTSGSGLDPELSPLAIRRQAARVAAARGLTPAQRDALDGLIAGLVEGGQLSPARINVLRLNLALDEILPPK